ncbi:DNA-binding PadR family transcriptional regulator [Okibacterium sp. HSC-33S16]|uniref:PadR family transcriptional regulator n=1 Tax=Okibacterium sp. HSC-33S16 TaxID=2910965 RepID=UPI0020A20F4E|nr:PadR family transcriptional regulator [Okibacterium sp. HSC-33S16]MCP2030750.1 DNA-binding PadR family transcriptional regulator [Okibacterium sp. HSC-33S16]
MAVKDAILAILSLGSAYGLQLRDELVRRAPHRAGVNVGQVYSTLDRLMRAGLIVSDDVTDDNLPLYALTPAGRQQVDDWFAVPIDPDVKNWPDMADQVLVASSIPGMEWAGVLSRQQDAWESKADAVANVSDDGTPTVQRTLALSADRHVAQAALDWLRDTSTELTTGGDPGLPLRRIRPQRGRRPGPVSRP